MYDSACLVVLPGQDCTRVVVVVDVTWEVGRSKWEVLQQGAGSRDEVWHV